MENIAPCLRLGETPRASICAARQPWKVIVFLPIVATQKNMRCRQRFVCGEGERERTVARCDALDNGEYTFQSSALAAILGGDG